MSTGAAADGAAVVNGPVAGGGPGGSDATGSAAASSSGVSAEASACPSTTQPVLLPVVLPPLPDEIAAVCCAELENGIFAVLVQVQPGMKRGVQWNALPACARICNRIAHMQLLGADLNNGRVDLYLPVDLGDLLKNHRFESTKAVANYKSGQETGGLEFRMPLAERWLREYHELQPESTLQLDSASCIQLLASVECFLAEFLEYAGKSARDYEQDSIDVLHLYLAILYDDELRSLCNYMRQPFEAAIHPTLSVSAFNELDTHLAPVIRRIQEERKDRDYARQSQQVGARNAKLQRLFPRYTPALQVAAEIFASNEPHLRTLLSTCWYHDPARVAHYAQLYVRGELKSPVSEYFASFGIRPMAFYGHARRAGLGGPTVDARSFCSFELWDPASRLWWPFVLSVRRSDRHSVFDFVLAVSWMHVNQGHLNLDKRDSPLLQPAARGMRTWSWVTLPRFGPKRAQQTGEMHLAASATTAGAASSSAPGSVTPDFAAAASSSSAAAPVAAATLAASASPSSSSPPPRDGPAARPPTFSAIVSAALLLGDFDRFGPALYSSNHPLRARVAFTAAALDVASAAASLPTLPSVLLDLIGEYAPTDLPYIAETSTAGEASSAPLGVAVRAARSALSAPISDRDWLPVGGTAFESQLDRSHEPESDLLAGSDHALSSNLESMLPRTMGDDNGPPALPTSPDPAAAVNTTSANAVAATQWDAPHSMTTQSAASSSPELFASAQSDARLISQQNHNIGQQQAEIDEWQRTVPDFEVWHTKVTDELKANHAREIAHKDEQIKRLEERLAVAEATARQQKQQLEATLCRSCSANASAALDSTASTASTSSVASSTTSPDALDSSAVGSRALSSSIAVCSTVVAAAKAAQRCRIDSPRLLPSSDAAHPFMALAVSASSPSPPPLHVDSSQPPFRICLSGGWLDQPWVSSIAPGSVIVINIQPTVDFNLRSGMATSSRALWLGELWDKRVMHSDPLRLARLLFGFENPPGTPSNRISGSQDHIGLALPGVSRLDYAGHHWPAHIERDVSLESARWLEAHLALVELSARPVGYDPLSVQHITKEGVQALALSAAQSWEGIQKRDATLLGNGVRGTHDAWRALLPHTTSAEIDAILRSYDDRALGASTSGCGGGYLILVLDGSAESWKAIPGSIRIRVRTEMDDCAQWSFRNQPTAAADAPGCLVDKPAVDLTTQLRNH